MMPPVPADPTARKIVDYDTIQHRAGRVVQGLPPVDPPPLPPPAPVPPPIHELGAEQIQDIGGHLAKLPPTQRAQAIIHAHGELAKTILQQGKIIIDGRLEVVKTTDQADSVAQRVINSEIDRRDKEADDAQKEAAKQVAKPKPATQEPTPRVSSRQRAAELAQPKYEVVEAPAPKFEVVEGKSPEVESGNGVHPEAFAGADTGSSVHTGEPSADRAIVESERAKPHAPGALANPQERAAGFPVSGSTFAKGDPVTFSKKMQVARGDGKSEIIPVGTKAYIEHAQSDGASFARVRMADGKVQSVPLRYLETGEGEPAPRLEVVESSPSKPAAIEAANAPDTKTAPQTKSTWESLNDDIRKRSWGQPGA